MRDPASALGVDVDPISLASAEALTDLSISRPFVRVEMASSLVNGDPLDERRFYAFTGGVAIGSEPNLPETGTLLMLGKDGQPVLLQGEAGILSVNASDSLGGQSASITMPNAGLPAVMAPLVRPVDRLRITVMHPAYRGGPWVAFDGLVRQIRSSRHGGGGFTSTLSIAAAGLDWLLSGAVFNWQGFVHPDSDILQGSEGKTLAAALGSSAQAPHLVVRAFVHSAINLAMGIRIGSLKDEEGLRVKDYALFEPLEAGDFSSLPGVAFPMPWTLIQAQSGASFWQIIQALAEPVLHEVFTGYRTPKDEMDPRPTLIHRPRPFPGLPKHDGFWRALPVQKVGGSGMPQVMGVDEVLSGDRHPNAFHWSGLGLGDHSTQAFNAKLFFGWATSDALVNRYGYSSHAVSSKLAPIEPGAPLDQYINFAKDNLEHFARQEVVLPLLKSRSLNGTFFPVRPGEVVEDHSRGGGADDVVTGYCTATGLSVGSGANGFSMSASISVERCLRGTDAAGYPDAVRALVPDLTLKNYAGKDVGELPPPPAASGTYKRPALPAAKPAGVPADLRATIQAASARQQIPAWLIAHVLHNETALGRNWGPESTATEARAKGIGQITSAALADLTAWGYTNPDGSAFTAADRGDVALNIHATAGYLKRCQELIEEQPGGFPSNGQSYYSWVCRAYRYGPAAARLLGMETGWTWPEAGEGYPDYWRYWSPVAIERAQTLWGWLG